MKMEDFYWLIDKIILLQKNTVIFFYKEDIYNIYWNSYNNNAPIMITTIKFGDITKKLEELDFKKAMNIDDVNSM